MSEITPDPAPLDPTAIGTAATDAELEDSSTSDAEIDQESSPEESAGPNQPKRKGVGARIDELTRLRHDAERDRDYWREFALKQQQPPAPQPQPTSEPAKEPQVGDFTDYTDYTRALVKWEAAQMVREQQQEVQRQAERTAIAERQATFQQRAAQFEATMPDFRAVAMNPSLPVTNAMAEAIQTSERGPELLYHLGKNPQDAARISMLPPLQAAVEIGRLEVKLSLPQPRRQSSAPEPVNTLGGGPGPAVTDDSRLSGDEWAKQRTRMLWERNQPKR